MSSTMAEPSDDEPSDDDPSDDVRSRPTLCLWGFMGTGKSTVGALVARQRGACFVDLDRIIEQRAGRSIRDMFEHLGEPAFRLLERESLTDALQMAAGETVIALGGGALIDAPTRRNTLRRTLVVGLTATVADIVARTRADATRPLLRGGGALTRHPTTADEGAAQRVRELLNAREAAYRDVHITLDTTGRNAAVVAAHLSKLWTPTPAPQQRV